MKVWFPLVTVKTGSDVYTVRLAHALKKLGIETEITYFPAYFEFCPGMLMRQSPPNGTNIIHGNSWTGFAFKRPGIPLVTTVHLPVMDPGYEKYKSVAQKAYHQLLVKRFEQRSLSASDRVVAVSNYVKNSISEMYPGTNATTIYNFVDSDIFKPAESPASRRQDKFRLLFVGNLTRRKGSDLLDQIMKRLGNNFVLTATTGLRNHHFSLSERNIVDAGKLEGKSLIQAYQNADALLFPTRLEGFGYSALEAMACGIPVIASNNTSLPEIVTDQKTGILCPTDNIDAFCQACEFLYNHPEKCVEYGRAGREIARKRFSPEVIAGQYATLYDELI